MCRRSLFGGESPGSRLPGCRVSGRCFHYAHAEEHRWRAGRRFAAPTRPPRPRARARQRPRARSTKLGTDVPCRDSVPGPRAWARVIGSAIQGGSGQPAWSAPAGREPEAFALQSDRPRESRWQAVSLPRAFDALVLWCSVADCCRGQARWGCEATTCRIFTPGSRPALAASRPHVSAPAATWPTSPRWPDRSMPGGAPDPRARSRRPPAA